MTATDELMETITELKSLFPQWRFGQLIANLLQAANKNPATDLWEISDEEIFAAARRLRDRNRVRLTDPE